MEEISHEDYFRVAGRFEDDPFFFQLVPEGRHVVDLTVVADDGAVVSELSCHGLFPALEIQDGQPGVGESAVS